MLLDGILLGYRYILGGVNEKRIGTFVFLAYLDKINPTLCTLTYNQELTDQITLDEDDE